MRRGLVVVMAAFAALATIILVERQTSAPVGNLVECGVVIGFLIVLAWATAGLARNALMVIASLLVGITLVDAGLLALEAREPDTAPTPTTYDPGLSKSRPVVGWGPGKPGVFHVYRTYPDGRVVYDVHVTIDATLNRKTVPSADSGAIAFFGDSFIFGEGLEDGETLPQAFAALNDGRIPVWNLAFPGWSPAQNLAALQAGLYKPLLGSPRRLILFTTAFHIERTACKGGWTLAPSARFVLVGDAVVNEGPCATPLKATLTRFARRFALYDRVARVFSGNTRADVATYLAILQTFVATAKRDYDAATTILFKPGEEEYLRGTGYTEAMLIDSLRKSGADVLVEALPPIADPSRYAIQGDGHPTALADSALARQIEDHLKAIDPAALGVRGARTTTR